MNALGISKSELADHIGIDRGTVGRAIKNDPSMTERTWARIENEMSKLEDELGMAESGGMVTSTIEYRGAKITMQGAPDDVAEAVRKVLGES